MNYEYDSSFSSTTSFLFILFIFLPLNTPSGVSRGGKVFFLSLVKWHSTVKVHILLTTFSYSYSYSGLVYTGRAGWFVGIRIRYINHFTFCLFTKSIIGFTPTMLLIVSTSHNAYLYKSIFFLIPGLQSHVQ